jgi:2-polyprenyl-3-methyl-5-hydroxy-6-metoxy-1,4-benzoquinol methylase
MEDPAYHIEAAGRKISFRKILWQLKNLQRNSAANVRLLDIGAATGLLLQEAEKLGWFAAGIEPSRWAADVATETHGLRVHCGTLKDCPFEKYSFDFITVVDVLEHVSDPVSLLKELRDWLKPDGIVCLVTPDFESLVARILKQKWWHIRQAHLYYFSELTLEKLVDSAQFVIAKKKRYGWTFSVDYWASRFENFYKPLFVLSQFMKKKTPLRSVYNWNIGINFGDSFEWYLIMK